MAVICSQKSICLVYMGINSGISQNAINDSLYCDPVIPPTILHRVTLTY